MNRSGLADLDAVVAVARNASFRRAAIELGLSPSALSHVITKMERRLAVRLFNRTTRSVSLSEAGQRFIARIGPAMIEIAEAMDSVNGFRDTPTGLLRISASEGGAMLVLRPVVLAFLARYPDMSIDLVMDGCLVDIVADRFDAGIRLAESVPQDMIAVPFGSSMRAAVVGSPAYFAEHPAPKNPADLAEHRCIRSRLPGGAVFRWEFEKRGEALHVDVPGQLKLNSHALMIEAALAGAGLAWVTEWSVAAQLASGALVRVLEDWTPSQAGLCLYYSGHRHVPAGLAALVAFVRNLEVADPRPRMPARRTRASSRAIRPSIDPK